MPRASLNEYGNGHSPEYEVKKVDKISAAAERGKFESEMCLFSFMHAADTAIKQHLHPSIKLYKQWLSESSYTI